MAAPGDFSTIVGRQRAVLPQAPPGGRVVVGGTIQSFDVMIIEAGTAVRETSSYLTTVSRRLSLVFRLL
jgi:hypothetical protein